MDKERGFGREEKNRMKKIKERKIRVGWSFYFFYVY